ncbi:helix-turn-helix transcriptional regulator [Carboxylicivirga sp. A043]|uniref:helix-turn-helix domain-containing protein n=1 Tax=Carboxylicivirga litoralis TaxID=2816963 RepID=UPI0021CAF8AB|nr:AraC family transcriptional regulator [Carboxylicivirga sp. A043]MCU4156898.1 helix-turn-helix transcriptional regulator [Carboxylicivirga sp. A043]
MQTPECNEKMSRQRQYLKLLIGLTSILIVASFLVYQFSGHSLDEQNKQMKADLLLVTSRLEDIKERAELAQTAILKSIAKFEIEDQDRYMDNITWMWMGFIEEYDVVYGIKGQLRNDTYVKIIRLGDNKYLRKIHTHSAKEVLCQQISSKADGIAVTKSWFQPFTSEEIKNDWVYQSRITDEPVVTSGFYNDPILKTPVLSISKRNKTENAVLEIISVKFALQPLAQLVYQSSYTENMFILSDGQQHVVLDNGDGVLNQSFKITQAEVKTFLDKTLHKQFYPDSPLEYTSEGTKYMGQWMLISSGNQEYKLAVVGRVNPITMEQIIYLIVIGLELMVLILLLIMYKKGAMEIPPRLIEESIGVQHENNDMTQVANVNGENESDIVEAINKHLSTGQPYLNVNYSLGHISEQIGIDRESIKNAIQYFENKTIKEKINDYRIQDAIQFLESDSNAMIYSMDSIALQFGFNSRTTFYREFKKRTNYTPAEFQTIKKIIA